jgi:hypothetical protein
MKSQFIPLLKYELMRFGWLVPLIYGFVTLYIYRDISNKRDYMFSLDLGGPETSIVMVLWFAFSAIFFANGISAGQKTGGMGGWSSSGFDFFFSRAIDRRLWFAIKTGLFLVIVMLPTLARWHSMQNSPTIRIELPYNSVEARKHVTAFYLANFEGAHLQAPDTGQNEDYVVLPHGKPAMADYFIASELLVLTFFQGAAFIFWPRGWWSLGVAFSVPFGLMALLAFPSAHSPSRYEEGIASVANHPIMTALSLLLFYLISQLYCGWRFVRTEMTS